MISSSSQAEMLAAVLTGLNKAQHTAVTSKANKILCLAGAGTGKTRVLTHRIARLYYEGIGCSNMLALTFTRLAGIEMKERVIKLIGSNEGKRLFCNTFHAFCVDVLRDKCDYVGLDRDFSIYDQQEQEAVVKAVLRDLGYKSMSLTQAIKAVRGSNPDGSKEAALRREYYFRLNQNNAIDFDSLIRFTSGLFKEHPGIRDEYRNRYPYAFVDEFQDTSDDQWELITLLEPENLFIVGDDFQGIYGWRGANISIILNLAQNTAYETVKLEENYRSTVPIIQAANTLIRKNSQTEKELRTNREGSYIKISSFGNVDDELSDVKRRIKNLIEAEGRQFKDIAILARTNKQLDATSQVLGDIPHVIVNAVQDPMKDPDVKIVFGFIEAVRNRENDSLIKKIANYPKPILTEKEILKLETKQLTLETNFFDALRCLTMPSVEKFFSIFISVEDIVDCYEAEPLRAFDEVVSIMRYANILKDVPPEAREAIAKWEERQRSIGEAVSINEMLNWFRLRDIQDRMADSKNEIKLMTVHASKGLEFDSVFIIGMNKGVFPGRGDIEEERRLFYVAITRAKNNLFVSRAKKIPDWSGNEIPVEESQFIREMQE